MRTTHLNTLVILAPFLIHAQTTPDGAIVPFSTLPTCASKCGPLFDVQGACAPPAQANVNDACFCSDTRLTPFLQGNANVQSVCGSASCSSDSDLTAVRSWYTSFCQKNAGNSGGSATTSAAGGSGGTATGTSGNGAAQTSAGGSSGSSGGGSGKPQSWLSTHYKWVIMLIVLFISITSIWIIAFLLRRRYLRKKEREIEMRPPVAIGPHQLQAMTGGYNYGDGVVDAVGRKSGGRTRGNGNGKEREKGTDVAAVATPADGSQRREKTGWLTKARK